MGKNTYTAAFMAVIEKNRGTLVKICLMFTDRSCEDIRDLYHDIVCRLWEAWPSFDGRSAVNTWLYRVALNTAISKQRRDRRSPDLVLMPDLNWADLAQEANDEQVEALYAAAARLEPAERALLRLYLDQLKPRDIAEVLGITEAAVRGRLNRMKRHLHRTI